MSKSLTTLLSFAAGEWAPTLTSRVDQAKYRQACLRLRNMLCLKTGPATRRPGTQYIAPTKLVTTATRCARLKPFIFSADTSFMLEWGQNYVRFFSNGAQVEVTSAPAWVSGTTSYFRNDYVTYSGQFYRCIADISLSTTPPDADPTHWVQQSILELWTPYTADLTAAGGDKRETEVFQLQFAQINDVMYVVHKNHPRWILTRISDESWTMKEVVELVPPLLDQNATGLKISSSATTGATTLDCSAPVWTGTTAYERGQVILAPSGPIVFYKATASFISNASFADDLLAGYWEVFTVFQDGHEGSYWELANLRPSAFVEYMGVAATGFASGESATITVYGDWEVRTYGVWSANVEVQGSADGGVTWQKLRTIAGRNDRNADISGKATTAMLMKIVVNNVAVPTTPGATDPRIVLEAVDGFLFGIVKITAVVNAYEATAQVITQLPVANSWVSGNNYYVGDRVGFDGVNYICTNDITPSTVDPETDTTNWDADGWPTEFWSEGAWSEVRGYPRAIAVFQQRVFCGFTDHEPLRVWGTKLNDLENWDLGDQSLADDGLAFDIDATGDGFGHWLAAQDALFAGFQSAEWVIGPNDVTGAITPTSITARRQSRFGSSPNVGAEVVGDALVFVDRQGFSVRQMLFSIATSKYMSADLTVLAENILNQGAVQIAYERQAQKNGFLWLTTVEGELVGMTYELEQEIFGWHRHTSDGDSFESVAVLPGKDGNDDEVWLVVSRLITGVPVRYVERINPYNWQRAGEKNRAYYVDCGVTVENPVSNTFTGLAHLNGRTVFLCVDGVNYGTQAVTGDSVTFDNYTPAGESYAHIGIPYTSEVEPMRLDSDERAGVTRGLMKKISRVVFDLYQTLDCRYREPSTGGQGVIDFRDSDDITAVPELFSGDKDVRDFPGDYTMEPSIIVFTSSPLPLSVRSLTCFYNLAGTV